MPLVGVASVLFCDCLHGHAMLSILFCLRLARVLACAVADGWNSSAFLSLLLGVHLRSHAFVVARERPACSGSVAFQGSALEKIRLPLLVCPRCFGIGFQICVAIEI